MFGKYAVSALAIFVSAALFAICLGIEPAQGYRICTFKGTVIDHGWRNMTVKSGNQCAEVNVGWRTKYIPNRRPCLGENVAVDFVLEDGYMKATKIVSLSPLPPSAQCYPPPPPSTSTCRTVPEEAATVTTEGCVPPQAVCTTRPPAHVTEPAWSPGKKEAAPKPSTKKPAAEKKPEVTKPAPKPGDDQGQAGTAPPPSDKFKSLTGEVVASSPKSLSVRVVDEGESAEVVNVRVGLKTKFIPFRRPAVGEKVKVEFRQENGDKFGYTVQVVQ